MRLDDVQMLARRYIGAAIERTEHGWWIYGPGGRAFMGDIELDRMRGDANAIIDRVSHLKPGPPPHFRFRIGRRLRV